MNAITEVERPAHSPLGGSGAERWINCAGSVALIKALKLPPSDEPEYRALGTAAHELGAQCLAKEGTDAWERIGEAMSNGVKVDTEMSDAVQFYLDTVRPHLANALPDTQVMIEYPISAPDVHKDYFGTVDLAVFEPCEGGVCLDLTDYKHGEGIVVEIVENEQLMYYAYPLLQKRDDIVKVGLRIVQPRIAWHPDGRARTWETTPEHICEWVEAVVRPAIAATEVDGAALDVGPWCRFCPAKLICPAMVSLFGAAAKADPKEVIALTNEHLGKAYQYVQGVKFYLKALEEETYRRLNSGTAVPGTKLVLKKANRVWKGNAEVAAKELLPPDDIYSKPEMKSPAEIDKLGPVGKKFTAEWAFTPQTGLTVALESDPKPAVKVESLQESFGAAVAAINTTPTDDHPDGLGVPAFLKRGK